MEELINSASLYFSFILEKIFVVHRIFSQANFYVFYNCQHLNALSVVVICVNTNWMFLKSPVASTNDAATCNGCIQQYGIVTEGHQGPL